ncbi:MAG: oligosaccharide flippase family protein [Alphaproteobacteria bacterium]|jgi:O-antigen/teichoic acid export membrane protein|nr:oligosaccharide flippase family protein [Alphaproteobacteria bacterium]
MSERPQAAPAEQTRSTLLRYVLGLAVRGAETLGKLGLYILVGHRLGAHDAGLFFLCLTWAALVATGARLGLDKALTRHIAAEVAVGAGGAARRAMRMGFGWTTLAGIVAAGITWALAGPAATYAFRMPDLAAPLALTAVVMLPQTLIFTLGSAMSGFKQTIAAQVVQNALWPNLTLAALFVGADTLDRLILALAGSMAVSCALAVFFLWRARGMLADRPAPTAEPVEPLPGMWHTAMPLLAVELTQVGLSSLPVLVLGLVADAAVVGAFSMANRISMLVWVIIIAAGTVAAPHFAELFRLGAIDRLRRYNTMIRRGVAAVGVPATLVMLAVPEMLLRLIAPEFDAAATALRIMAIGQMINCLLPVQDVLLGMTGNGGVLRRLNMLQLAVGLVASAALIPIFGIVGAASVAALVTAQGAIGTTLATRRLLLAENTRYT